MADIARNIDLYGKSFVDVMRMTVSEARQYFESMPIDEIRAAGSLTPWEEAVLRLRTMDGVGLGYLTLNRKSKTLSGGECQRLHLSCGLGRGLCDTLYVLDEPTAGLHPVDSMKLVHVMKSLMELGNTLVVVEHDVENRAFRLFHLLCHSGFLPDLPHGKAKSQKDRCLPARLHDEGRLRWHGQRG